MRHLRFGDADFILYSMTIDDLALLIQNTVAEKEDLAGLATKKDLEELESRTDAKFDALEQKMNHGLHILNEQIKQLNFSVEIDDWRERMQRVEHQLGIK